MKRVVVTGMGGISPIGSSAQEIQHNLRQKKGGISYMPEWDQCTGLRTRLAGVVRDFQAPAHYDRKKTRSMGRVALFATRATELALQDAGLAQDAALRDGSTGIAYGSATGSPSALSNFIPLWNEHIMKGISATSYLQMMPHTSAANIGVFFGITGRIIPTCSACTSGSQGIGYAYETIKHGKQSMMIAGGAEELCVTIVAVFDSMYATSTRNQAPDTAVRPFDRERDGVVIGEGAATLILEELMHARARGAEIFAEIVGYGTNSDGQHMTNPAHQQMRRCMEISLEDAELPPEAIGYVNAHAAGTHNGDPAEAAATQALFGSKMPISSLKSYFGHTLGASGALEAWTTIMMMNGDWYAPTLNLENPAPECPELDYLVGDGRKMQSEYVMSNNFAFGGTNTSLIFKRWA